MDTATRGQRAFVNVAGFIYASFGFSLSVIAAVFNLLFQPSNSQHELILPLPSHAKPAARHHHTHTHTHGAHARPRRIVRSLSEHPSPTEGPLIVPETSPIAQRSKALLPAEKKTVYCRKSLPSDSPLKNAHNISEVTPNEKSLSSGGSKENALFNMHARSQSESIPSIMVGHHDSSEHVSWKNPEFLTEEPAPFSAVVSPPSQSLQTLQSPPSSAQTTNTVKSNPCACPTTKLKPRLFDPKTWGSHKRLKRCQSSPQLSKPPGVPFVSSPPPLKSHGSDSESQPAHNLKKSKSWKHLRKAKSGPINNDKATSKTDRKADKKRSQTLRTHPYEAPYFAPPPVPSVPVHVTLIPDQSSSDYASSIDSTKSSLDKKLSRSLMKA
ncbi:hypothetical protein BDN70DRAFT_988040 [Pholiota conissans]|uniref:Uncharacterized protein n=1 Tax=Pholiota conissans TaxID=109636 RepID=A0A9P6D0M0_9AGAR|nr:hypothetical protein BDN70DRAFT_988040 [Pholiota conissans]